MCVPLVPAGRAHPRRLSHRFPGRRRARQGQYRRMARGQEVWHGPQRRRGPDQGRPVGAAEERVGPDRRPTRAARVRREHQRDPLGRVQAQGTPQDDPQAGGADAATPPAAPVGRGRIPVRHRGILGEKIARRRFDILRIRTGLPNARLEVVNNKIKTTIKIGYGYRSLDNLIALVMLKCGRLDLQLPGRQ